MQGRTGMGCDPRTCAPSQDITGLLPAADPSPDIQPTLPSKRKMDPSTVDPVGRAESSRFLDSWSELFRRNPHVLGLPDYGHRHGFLGKLWKAASGYPSQMPGTRAHLRELHLPRISACAGACIFQPLRALSPPGPSPRAALRQSDVEPSTEDSPAVPAGGWQPQGGARLAFAPAPGASGLHWRPPSAARLHANGLPPPAFLLVPSPPCARPAPGPARPGKKALIGKIAQEPGAVRGARHELHRPVAWRRRPPG
ncbi:uncharacterized protein LOC124972336 [Sciurus carolinensis]|uniref:uncharacterized protein LOC124972336 n=1 Tax=Sciurus carolinensis TaxID=30640 RepID=UPI001FB3CF6F|nr:uncharacterized protein LOC124972336 [Sciurus carolinensis]